MGLRITQDVLPYPELRFAMSRIVRDEQTKQVLHADARHTRDFEDVV